MVVGCYSLDLYCEVADCDSMLTFTDRTLTGAIRNAKKSGWSVYYQKNICYCPKHRRKKLKVITVNRKGYCNRDR